jgi:hypothetical protein
VNIQTERLPTGEYRALDADEYEAESDVNGWWSCSLVGYGSTAQAAIADLLAEIEDRKQ